MDYDSWFIDAYLKYRQEIRQVKKMALILIKGEESVFFRPLFVIVASRHLTTFLCFALNQMITFDDFGSFRVKDLVFLDLHIIIIIFWQSWAILHCSWQTKDFLQHWKKIRIIFIRFNEVFWILLHNIEF